jgi:hypothetical protein
VRAVEVGTAEPALFLHGFSLCPAHWTPLFARLPSLRRIAIDMPGHGASGGVDYCGVNLRSWYTQMLTSTLDAPERVRSLVTIGTPAVALGARLDGLDVPARDVQRHRCGPASICLGRRGTRPDFPAGTHGLGPRRPPSAICCCTRREIHLSADLFHRFRTRAGRLSRPSLRPWAPPSECCPKSPGSALALSAWSRSRPRG